MPFFDRIRSPFQPEFWARLNKVADKAMREYRGGGRAQVYETDDSVVVFVPNGPAGESDPEILVEITSVAETVGYGQWTYNFTQRANWSAGTVADPLTGTCVNGFELFNTTASVGVNVNILNTSFFAPGTCTGTLTASGGFTVKPIGRIMTRVAGYAEGTNTVYGFSHPNAIDGDCIVCS